METVLIIEDDSTMLRGLKDNFAYAGYNVLTAADGEIGLNAALDARPDLIILDIMLPKIQVEEISSISSFLWNLWIRSPESRTSELFYSQEIIESVKKRISYKVNGDLEYCLVLTGIYNLIYKSFFNSSVSIFTSRSIFLNNPLPISLPLWTGTVVFRPSG